MIISSISDLDAYVGREVGVSAWHEVSQDVIDLFARATGDFQWIHVDTKRALAEMPDGRTIAHGYLVLSLIPRLAAEIYQLDYDGPVLNYGLNKVRFTQPVPSGSLVRLRLSIAAVERTAAGIRIITSNAFERKGSERPVLFAETIVFVPPLSGSCSHQRDRRQCPL